jgi:uncharacterized protein YaaR (DUF327 family)
MTIKQLVKKATNKDNFTDLKGFISFSKEYLSYINNHLQAVIVSQNENHYRFYQYDKSAHFQITIPINSKLMYDTKEFAKISKEYVKILKSINKNI